MMIKVSSRLAVIILACLELQLTADLADASWNQLYQADGPIDLEISGFAAAGAFGGVSGNITLSNIPSGATIDRAVLIAGDWTTGFAGTRGAVFAGNNLGNANPSDVDNSYLYSYQWDVTPYITGNGTYAASASGMQNNYGLALAVVYRHASLPAGRVSLNNGANIQPLQFGGAPNTTLSSLGGPGELWVYTGADDNFNGFSSGEQVRLNGGNVGGPLDGNLGDYASILELSVNTLPGNNVANIVTPSDTFGWHLAGLHSLAIPEPGSALLAVLAAGVIYCRRTARRSAGA